MTEAAYPHLVFTDRIGTNCEKWDNLVETFGRDDVIATWVADMDIEAPAGVREAITDAARHNVYGYYKAPGELHEAFIDWERRYHGYDVDEAWIRYSPGVVQSIYWLLQILTEPQDNILISTPVYYLFMDAIRQTGRQICPVPLINDSGQYTFDCDAFEQAIVDHHVKAYLLCSPHNPVGRVWSKEELRSILDICMKHHVYVIADEIHQDLVIKTSRDQEGQEVFAENTPAATTGDYDSILITLVSASKTFNLAGMQHSFVIIPDAQLRARFDAFAEKIHILSGTNIGYAACTAALRGGRDWLMDLRHLIKDNDRLLREALGQQAPDVIISPLEGTYLQWLDLSAYAGIWESQGQTIDRFIVDQCRVAPDFGAWFGGEAFERFIRLNLATSPATVQEIADRIGRGLSA